MKTDKINPAWLWLVMITIVLFVSACSSQTPPMPLSGEVTPTQPSAALAQSTNTALPPTSTPAPSPTSAPSPVPGLLGYLPSPADLPSGFGWDQSWEAPHMFDPNTTLEAAHTILYSDAGWLKAEVYVAPKPYEIGAVVTQLSSDGTLVETAPVGSFSAAYLISENPPYSSFSFVKGNTLVKINGPVTVEEAVTLAKKLELRIPDNVTELTPITFPDQLDPAAAAQFGNYLLGECTSESTVTAPLTVLSVQNRFNYCLQMDWVDQEPDSNYKLEYAIYDVQNQEYIFKYSSTHGFGSLFLPGQPGNYELRVAVDDALVAALPFEMR
jgi:hypothetical protein